jgi:glycosyltransferase involved in cell wall biosynthesis
MSSILYINPTAVHGGAEEALLGYMRSVKGMSYQPILVVPKQGWLTEQCSKYDIPCEYLPSLPDPITADHWSAQLEGLIPNTLHIIRLVRKWQAVLVHSNTPRVSYHGGLGARLSHVKAVAHVHDSFNLPYASTFKSNLLATLTDRIIAVSNAVKRAIVSVAPKLVSKIETVYNGWNVDIYENVQVVDLYKEWGIPQNRIVIGSASVLRPIKGQDILIDAFNLLNQKNSKTHLLIIGGGQGRSEEVDYEQQLHEKVCQYGLEHAVTFTGWQENIWPLIKSLDIFAHVPVMPDSLPTAILHASALGKAIVASNIGGIPEIVIDKETGILVQPRDVQTLYQSLNFLTDDVSIRNQLGQHARVHFIKKFSHVNMCSGLSKVYTQVLSMPT